MSGKWPLFWCLKVDRQAEIQAKLMQYQWDNYGEKLEIPTPPGTSDGVWLTVELENAEEIDRIMRQAPKKQRRIT